MRIRPRLAACDQVGKRLPEVAFPETALERLVELFGDDLGILGQPRAKFSDFERAIVVPEVGGSFGCAAPPRTMISSTSKRVRAAPWRERARRA